MSLPFVTIAAIKEATARHYMVSPLSIDGPSVEPHIARPRQVVILLSRELTNKSFGTIGHYIGQRAEATIRATVRSAARRLKADPSMQHELAAVRAAVIARFGAR